MKHKLKTTEHFILTNDGLEINVDELSKVEASATNGKIKINGTDTTVYTHPGSGTNPHGTTKSDVGLGNVGNFKAVSTVASQGLSSTEQSNARANIGAGTSSLVLGEGETNAYYGDKGKIAYDHSQAAHARTDATKVEASSTNGKIKINGTETTVYTHPSGTNPHGTTKSDVGLGNVTNDSQVKRTEMGVASGVATLGSDGKVPSDQLPSFVDDVIDLLNVTNTAPSTCLKDDKYYNTSNNKIYTATAANTWGSTGENPESGKIYINLNNSKTYRWSGTTLVVISETLALGETSSTAYRGDRGKTAYDHSQATHARTDATNTDISYTSKKITKTINGTTSDVVSASTIVTDGGGIKSHAEHKLIASNGTASAESQGTEITFVESVSGTSTATSGDLTVSTTRKKITVPAIPGNATQSTSGLMSSADKTKLNGIEANANAYSHPTGDGNSHVPATGTGNNGKVLMAGSTANSASWQSLGSASLKNVPTSGNASATEVVMGNDSRLTNARAANGGNSDTVDGYHLAVVSELPASPDENTIYIVK